MKMKKAKRICLILILILCMTILGCSYNGSNYNHMEVNLRVTQNFGEEVIFDESVKLDKDSSALDVLMDNLEVEVAYGGGFVNAIEGLKSGFTGAKEKDRQKNDWFYFINGIMSNTGAGEYMLKSGDVIWWDYHSWDDTTFTPAVCGCFPQPFINGFGDEDPKVTILYGDAFKAEALKLKNYLGKQGSKDISLKAYEAGDLNGDDNMYIVIDTVSSIMSKAYWQGIMKNRQKTGWFAEIGEQGITGYDISESNKKIYKKDAGAVLVSGQGMGANPVWLFTAMDGNVLKNIIEDVIDKPEKLKNKAGAIYYDGDFIALPLKQEG